MYKLHIGAEKPVLAKQRHYTRTRMHGDGQAERTDTVVLGSNDFYRHGASWIGYRRSNGGAQRKKIVV
jgi:hypothetical protein